MAHNEWICTAERTLLESPVMSIVQRDCRSSEDDRPHRFYLMKSRDWCNVIPITEDGNVVLVRQFRIGIDDHTTEVPGGVTDTTDKDPMESAIREMTEETGYVPLPGAKCEELGWCFPNPAILNNRSHTFVVGPVKRMREQNLDAGEMIDVVEIPIAELPARIANGEIRHALTLMALFFLLMRADDGSAVLRRELALFTGRGRGR